MKLRVLQSTYYDAGGIETIEIIRAKLTPEEFRGYCKGNVLKYACRMAFRGCAARDADKAARYAAWLKECYDGPLSEAPPQHQDG